MGTEILLILQYVGIGLTALLTLDNALDAIAKAFGNKKWDTIFGQWAVALNQVITTTKSVTPATPVAPVPTTDTTSVT